MDEVPISINEWLVSPRLWQQFALRNEDIYTCSSTMMLDLYYFSSNPRAAPLLRTSATTTNKNFVLDIGMEKNRDMIGMEGICIPHSCIPPL